MSRLIITVIYFFVALALGLGFIWPKYQNLRILQAEIEKKEAEFQSKTDYFSQVKDVFSKMEQYKEVLSKISNALPPNPSLPSLFNFLQITAAQAGLILEEINLGSIIPLQDKELTGVKEIYANLQLSGSYLAFKNFLLAVEKSARIIEVRKISFSTPKELKESFSFEIAIKTYSY